MKEIKSERYLRKEAIYGNFPIGDPGLPGNLTERDIPDSIPPDEISNQSGETEVEVNWPEFSEWFSQAGESLPWFMRMRVASSFIKISYEYNYDYNTNNTSNIKVTHIKDYKTGQIINDSYILESFGEYFEDHVKNDIEIGEEGANLERTPSYNPLG